MALQHPAVEVEAITTVSGNVNVQQASINARYTLQICKATVPVYEGCHAPLEREVAPADWFHGSDGMGDMFYPAPDAAAQTQHAVDELIRRFQMSDGQIELVTLGPLTNIATALKREPALAQWIKHCYVMGGAACTNGNVTPAAEYNIWCDPEAAHIVFHSGMAMSMIGWELSCGDATLDDQEMQEILALKTERAKLAIECNSHALKAVREIQGEAGLALADPVAMAVVLEPSICSRRSNHYVDISCDPELTRGMTVVDKLGVTGHAPNVDVCWELDSSAWKHLLRRSLS